MSYEGNVILVLDVVFHIMLVFIYCKTVFLIFQKSAHGDPAVDFHVFSVFQLKFQLILLQIFQFKFLLQFWN